MLFERTTSGGLADVCRLAKKSVQSFSNRDETVWRCLARPVDDATDTYVMRHTGHVASLAWLLGVKQLGAAAESNGPAFPFVFGATETNGLLTAALFVLDNVATALYATSVELRDTCLTLLCPGERLWSLLSLLAHADDYVLAEDAAQRYRVCVTIAALSKHANVCGKLEAAAVRAVRLAYHEMVKCGSQVLSEELMKDVHAACVLNDQSTRSRLLVARKIEADVLAAAPTECADTSSVWSRVAIAADHLGVSMDALSFESAV